MHPAGVGLPAIPCEIASKLAPALLPIVLTTFSGYALKRGYTTFAATRAAPGQGTVTWSMFARSWPLDWSRIVFVALLFNVTVTL